MSPMLERLSEPKSCLAQRLTCQNMNKAVDWALDRILSCFSAYEDLFFVLSRN